MKKLFTLTLASLLSLSLLAQSESDGILGEWYTAEKDAVVTIFLDGETISGKTTWMEEPNESNGNPKLDKQNP